MSRAVVVLAFLTAAALEATPIHYRINFDVGAQGEFSYDPDTGTFPIFRVRWNNITFNFPSTWVGPVFNQDDTCQPAGPTGPFILSFLLDNSVNGTNACGIPVIHQWEASMSADRYSASFYMRWWEIGNHYRLELSISSGHPVENAGLAGYGTGGFWVERIDPVPEPGTLALVASAAGLVLFRRRR